MAVNTIAIRFLAVEWILLGLAIIAVALRFISSAVCHRRFGWEDSLVVLALAITIVLGVITTKAFDYGFGLHVADLISKPADLTNALKYIQLQSAPSVLSPLCSRSAFSLYLLKIIGTSSKWQRNSLWFLIISQVLINVGTAVLSLALCGTHITAIWGAEKAKCLPNAVLYGYAYFAGATNVLSDIYLSVVPAYIVMRLHMPPRRKIQLMVLLCSSLLVAVACLIKTILISRLGDGADYTFDALGVVLAGEVEATLIIILICIPTWRGLFSKPARVASKGSSKGYQLSAYRPGQPGQSKVYCAAEPAGTWSGSRGTGIFTTKETIVSTSEEDILRSKY